MQANNDCAVGMEFGMPTHAAFGGMRRCGGRIYTEFIDRFVRAVVGARRFDKIAERQTISNFVYVSDEAFALLIYENQEERWWDMFRTGKKTSDKKGKYTDGGKSSKDIGRSRQGKGWDIGGLRRFNELCRKVQEDRKGTECTKFELDYKNHRLEMKDEKRRQSKESQEVAADSSGEEENVDVFHEMEGLEPEGLGGV